MYRFICDGHSGGWKFSIVTEPYGDVFHLKRRYINQALNPSGTKKQYNMLNDNMRLFIQSLLQNPSKIQAYNRMCDVSLTLQIVRCLINIPGIQGQTL